LSIFWAGNWHKIGSFFAYYSLVSSADSQIKTNKQKHQYFGAKICYLPFCLYFLSFFFPPKKNSAKSSRAQNSAQKCKQLNDKQFCAFNF